LLHRKIFPGMAGSPLLIEQDNVIQITAASAPGLLFSRGVVALQCGLPNHGALP